MASQSSTPVSSTNGGALAIIVICSINVPVGPDSKQNTSITISNTTHSDLLLLLKRDPQPDEFRKLVSF